MNPSTSAAPLRSARGMLMQQFLPRLRLPVSEPRNSSTTTSPRCTPTERQIISVGALIPRSRAPAMGCAQRELHRLGLHRVHPWAS